MREKFKKLVSPRNIERVKKAIEVKYGFLPSDKYCRDLIRFVTEVTDGPE